MRFTLAVVASGLLAGFAGAAPTSNGGAALVARQETQFSGEGCQISREKTTACFWKCIEPYIDAPLLERTKHRFRCIEECKESTCCATDADPALAKCDLCNYVKYDAEPLDGSTPPVPLVAPADVDNGAGLVARQFSGEGCPEERDEAKFCFSKSMTAEHFTERPQCIRKCKQRVCCGKPVNPMLRECDLCHGVECGATSLDSTPRPVNDTINLNGPDNDLVERQHTVPACFQCQARFQWYLNKDDCYGAMKETCNNRCRDSCDYDCACKRWENPTMLPTCVATAGKACIA